MFPDRSVSHVPGSYPLPTLQALPKAGWGLRSRQKLRREDARDLLFAQQLLLAQQIGNGLSALCRLLRELGRARVADQRIEGRCQRGRADVIRLAALAIGLDSSNALLH